MSHITAHRRSADAFSNINTTPLVDVMLVLLIIFMIAAPLFTHQIDFKLPGKTRDASKVITDPLLIEIISVGRATHFALDGATMDQTELVRRLRAAAIAAPERGFILRAAPEAAFDQVSVVMALVRRAGLQRGSFELDPH